MCPPLSSFSGTTPRNLSRRRPPPTLDLACLIPWWEARAGFIHAARTRPPCWISRKGRKRLEWPRGPGMSFALSKFTLHSFKLKQDVPCRDSSLNVVHNTKSAFSSQRVYSFVSTSQTWSDMNSVTVKHLHGTWTLLTRQKRRRLRRGSCNPITHLGTRTTENVTFSSWQRSYNLRFPERKQSFTSPTHTLSSST